MADEHLNLDQLELSIQGEKLSPTEEGHLNSCDACRKEIECLTSLAASGGVTGVAQTGEKVLALRRVRRSRSIQRLGAVASVVFAFLLLTMGLPFLKSPSHQARSLSVAWLEDQQSTDGSWSVEDWGGKSKFKVGISSMALLAILKEPGHNRLVISRGLSYLLEEQHDNGAIGGSFLGDLYNHSLATLVLREAGRRGYSIPAEVLDSATAFLVTQRQKDGRWGYTPHLNPEKNLSAWASRAMDEALKNPTESLGAAVVSSSETFEEVRVASAVKKLDPMSAYLEGLNLPKAGKTQWQKNLVALQERDGNLAGSWPADDRWGRVGGRVFCTGMAVLALD